jgi:hypothetical protein
MPIWAWMSVSRPLGHKAAMPPAMATVTEGRSTAWVVVLQRLAEADDAGNST